MYYEYRQVPCTHLHFFEDATTVSLRPWRPNGQQTNVCANPKVAAGSAVCCGGYGTSKPQTALPQCLFLEERVTYDTAEERCVDTPYYERDEDGYA